MFYIYRESDFYSFCVLGLLSVSGLCCLVELPDFLYPWLSCSEFQKKDHNNDDK